MSELDGTVLSMHGGCYRVLVDGREVVATLRGRLKQRRDRVVVGDRVAIAAGRSGSWTIECQRARTSVLRRMRPGGHRGTRVVAANVDRVVVVGAADCPAWDATLMDRFVAVAEANRLPVVIVINKCDLHPDPGSLGAPLRGAGYPVHYTSALDRRGLDQLSEILAASVSLLTGPTGVGKSSLLNALEPGLQLRTQPVGRRRGRHTTVAAELHRVGRKGLVADTPGLQDIRLGGMAPREVAHAFPEFRAYVGQCRFDNCRHQEEPECAVVQAAQRGDINWSRLCSYRMLLTEVTEAGRPWE
ncbi:MAG TPA: ribosome small subunit-dependent GTPase A [Gemmatimonadales bacterium]|nr:ribosome small subunit-dependent GTPase A [Gemmatimonadales bacterium]